MNSGNAPLGSATSAVPAQWLRNLLSTNHPTTFPWGWSIRCTLGMGLVLVPGALLGQQDIAVFAAIGVLLNSATQHLVAGRVNLAQMAIAVPMGVFGHFVGVLAHGALWRQIVVLAALAALSAVVSAFGAAYSVGSIQMMVLAIISSVITPRGPWWLPALLFIGGAALAALLLAIEMIVRRDHPERDAYAGLLGALSSYMRKLAKGTITEADRQNVLAAQQSAYQNLLQNRLAVAGETAVNDSRAAALAAAAALRNRLFAQQYQSNSATELETGADYLDQVGAALVDGKAPPRPPETDSPLFDDINSVTQSLRAADSRHALLTWHVPAHHHDWKQFDWRRLLDVAASSNRDAIRLALCIAVAVLVASWLPTHSFWIPLMVVTIMKPDFGSVFARAIQRVIGTIVGAGIGAGLLWIIPARGVWMAVLIAVLAFFMPWGSTKGFWVMTIFITALVVPMVSWMDDKAPTTLAGERILDTIIAGALALVFGYLLWPTTYKTQVRAKVSQQLRLIGALLRAVTAPSLATSSAQGAVSRARAETYRGLANLHIQLQRALAEPGPIGKYEAAWFPIVAALGRMCDILTAYSLVRESDPNVGVPAADVVAAQLSVLSQLETGLATTELPAISSFGKELAHLSEIMEQDESVSST